MKVLWFANTPCNADEYFNTELKGTGGWLKALDIEMQEKVDLHIAFYSNQNLEPFVYKKTTYYPIYVRKNLVGRIWNRLVNTVVLKEHLNLYKQIVNKVNPDIIHIHGTENPFGYIANETDIPVVISIQGNMTVYYHKYLTGLEKKYLKVTNFSFKNLLGIFDNYRNNYRAFFKMMYREQEILRNSKHIIGRTDWDYYITRVLASNSKYYHCDEILRDCFYKNAGKWKPHRREKQIVLTVTGSSFYKGIETVCQALFELQSIGVDVELRVAGISRSDLIVKVVKKKLGRKYPQKGIIYLGKINEIRIVEHLIESDIYVMSSHIENSPNNLCEAMIIGIPCVATHAGGTGTLLIDKIDGLLLQDGDPWAMAGAIMEILQKTELAKQYSINARNKTLKRHNKINISVNLLHIYKEIIMSRGEG